MKNNIEDIVRTIFGAKPTAEQVGAVAMAIDCNILENAHPVESFLSALGIATDEFPNGEQLGNLLETYRVQNCESGLSFK